jgi:hypothetical protein
VTLCTFPSMNDDGLNVLSAGSSSSTRRTPIAARDVHLAYQVARKILLGSYLSADRELQHVLTMMFLFLRRRD